MPELRLALIALGIVLVIAVYLFTRWQSRRGSRPSDPGHPASGRSTSGRPARRLDGDDLPPVRVRPSAEREGEAPSGEEELPPLSPGPRRGGLGARAAALLGRGRDVEDAEATHADEAVEPETPPAAAEGAGNSGEPASPAEPGSPAEEEPALDTYDPASQKIISLHVRAADEDGLDGAGLRRVLERAGAHHGQYDIFHRSESDASGRPALLFSIANMVEPGYFDLEAMDENRYRGVTLFAVLPGPLPGIQTFHEMLGLAHRIAEELEGDVLDEARNPFSVQRATHIEEQIVEFERLRRRENPEGDAPQ